MKLDQIIPGDIVYIALDTPTDQSERIMGIDMGELGGRFGGATARNVLERHGMPAAGLLRKYFEIEVVVVAVRAPYKSGMLGVTVRAEFEAIEAPRCTCTCGHVHWPQDEEGRVVTRSVEFTVHYSTLIRPGDVFERDLERELRRERWRAQRANGGGPV
jgi:hypothetical protein